MHDAQGVGLAATQVGVLRRLFVFEPDEDGPRAVVNPVIVERGEETLDRRGGLPVAARRARAGRARDERSCSRARTQNGDDVRYELDRPTARASSQHELDHLDGVLIIDRTDDEHRKEALATLRPRAVLARDADRRRGDGAARRRRARAARGARTRSRSLLTRPDAPQGRGRKLGPPPAKVIAERLGIPVHQPEKPELPAETSTASSSARTASTSRRGCSSARSG